MSGALLSLILYEWTPSILHGYAIEVPLIVVLTPCAAEVRGFKVPGNAETCSEYEGN